MAADPADAYITLTVRLFRERGDWVLAVDGLGATRIIPLRPAIIVFRFQRTGAGNTLRGTVRLHGSDTWAPLQSSRRLERLVRVWLLDEPD